MKIVKIIIAHFGSWYVNMAGGVEKVTCNLANAMVERGHEVTILYRDEKEGQPYFYLDSRVKQQNILYENGVKVVSEKLPLPLRIVREIVRPFKQSAAQAINAEFKGKQYGPRIKKFLDTHPADVILSCSIPSAKYVIEDAGCTLPVVEMVHSQPKVQFPSLSMAEKEAAKKCKAMQILTPSGISLAEQYFPQLPIVVIGNAVFPARKEACPGKIKEQYKIVCVGNVGNEKKQFVLAKAFLPLIKEYPDWSLEFWGQAATAYAKYLEDWIYRHHAEKRIHINGKTEHVDDVYADSDIFCMPSKNEGFPLALTEAMAAGIPVIGFKDCAGVNDIIVDGLNGYLIPRSLEELTKALKKLMDNRDLRQRMGNAGIESMKQYNPQKIWDQWEQLLQRTIAETNQV